MGSDVRPRPLRAMTLGFSFLLGTLATGCTNVPADLLGSNVDAGSDAPVEGGSEEPADGGSGEPAGDEPDATGGDVSETPGGDEPEVIAGDSSDVPASDVPANDYCAAVADWPEPSAAFELEVLQLVNERRATGADCGEAGVFEAVSPLTMNDALRCAARVHSLDMVTRGYFSHTNPEGAGPRERTAEAGYVGSTWGENIAAGYPDPASVIEGWMNSPGHCANMMRSSFTEIGVGYAAGAYWTQNFGAP